MKAAICACLAIAALASISVSYGQAPPSDTQRAGNPEVPPDQGGMAHHPTPDVRQKPKDPVGLHDVDVRPEKPKRQRPRWHRLQ